MKDDGLENMPSECSRFLAPFYTPRECHGHFHTPAPQPALTCRWKFRFRDHSAEPAASEPTHGPVDQMMIGVKKRFQKNGEKSAKEGKQWPPFCSASPQHTVAYTHV